MDQDYLCSIGIIVLRIRGGCIASFYNPALFVPFDKCSDINRTLIGDYVEDIYGKARQVDSQVLFDVPTRIPFLIPTPVLD